MSNGALWELHHPSATSRAIWPPVEKCLSSARRNGIQSDRTTSVGGLIGWLVGRSVAFSVPCFVRRSSRLFVRMFVRVSRCLPAVRSSADLPRQRIDRSPQKPTSLTIIAEDVCTNRARLSVTSSPVFAGEFFRRYTQTGRSVATALHGQRCGERSPG